MTYVYKAAVVVRTAGGFVITPLTDIPGNLSLEISVTAADFGSDYRHDSVSTKIRDLLTEKYPSEPQDGE